MKVQIDKSIKRNCIVYKFSFELLSDYFFCILLGIITLGLCALLLLKISESLAPIYCYYIFSGFFCWFLVNILLTNKLVSVIGGYLTNNKLNTDELIKTTFRRIQKQTIATNMVTYRQEPQFIGPVREITCLFKDNTIFINIKSLGKGDVLTPFSGLFNYYRAKKLIKKLKK